MYLLAAGYNINKNIKETLDHFRDVNILEYIKCLSDVPSQQVVLEMRYPLALKNFSSKEQDCGKYINVDYACNVTFIFEYLLFDDIFCAIFTKLVLNQSCMSSKIFRKIKFLPIKLFFSDFCLENAICLDICESGYRYI